MLIPAGQILEPSQGRHRLTVMRPAPELDSRRCVGILVYTSCIVDSVGCIDGTNGVSVNRERQRSRLPVNLQRTVPIEDFEETGEKEGTYGVFVIVRKCVQNP